MTLVCSVMAWGTEIEVDNFVDLKAQLSASGTADVVKLKKDIAYPNTTDLLDIQRSVTVDFQGHKITGYHANLPLYVQTAGAQGKSTAKNAVLALNNSQDKTKSLDIVIKNAKFEWNGSGRLICYAVFDGVNSLTIDNMITDGKSNDLQVFFITGEVSDPLELTLTNSKIEKSAQYSYPAYIMRPIDATLTNTYITGYCALYFKHQYSGYGQTYGTRGSVVNANACTFDCPNALTSGSNNFAVFPLEDDGITLNLHNCSYNTEEKGDTYQRLVSMQYYNKASSKTGTHDTFLGNTLNISGDNTHIYNLAANVVAFNGWVMGQYDPHSGEGGNAANKVNSDLNINITGGTFSFDPREAHWAKYGDGKVYPVSDGVVADGQGAITIDDTKYDVKKVNQGGVDVWRVVPKTTTLYNLNSDVPEEEGGAGQNPNTSFELSNGSAMTLDQPTTKAGYVEVSGGTTVTVATDQTLVINNGLDVQGSSVVTAKPGSALVIGEGGIVTQSPANIVVEADNNGAASLLLDPTITVNQTPKLTVKMVAKNVGKFGTDYFWHRFALPVDEVHVDAVHPENSTWIKDGHSYGTLLYKWDYTNNKWVSLSNVNEMQPFYGYTMTLEHEVASLDDLKEAGYIFKGKLMGNVPSVLNFSRQGYNYFGNSYTGYISIVKLVDELIGNDNLDGTVWMWDPTTQKYEGIPLNDLKNNSTASRYTGPNSWKAEVAPMQTFILRLMTEDTDTKANIDYATAVWGNPRYEDVTGASHAPARRAESNNETYVRVIVSAANGKADAVNFQEGVNFSDANDRGYDAAKYMNERTVNVYATVNGENYGTVATDNIEGQSLTINTIDEIAYTISFADVEGRELALRDNVTGQVINIEEGATYEFAAQPNSTVEGRFEIINRAQMPTAIENTEVKANVKGIYTIMGQYLGENFDILPAGVYVVDGVKIVK